MPSSMSRRQFLGTVGVGAVGASAALRRPVRAATAPGLTWSRTYRPSGDAENSRDLCRTIVPVAGGYVLGGVTGQTASRGWAAGVDAAGREQWHKTLGVETSYFVDGVPAPNGGALLAGVTNRTDEPDEPTTSDPWVVSISSDGDVRWSQTYQPDAPSGGATAIVRTGDSYALAGAVDSGSGERPWVARLDDDATVQWRWHSTVEGRTGRAGAIASVDGGLVVGGSDEPADADQPAGRMEDAWIARLAADGTETWRRRFERDRGDRIEGIAPAGGGDGEASGVVAVGRRDFATDDEGDGWSLALDAAGETRWQRTYPRETWNWLHEIVPAGDGYVLVGTRELGNSDTRGAWLLRVGPEGRPQWEARYTDDEYTRGYDALPTDDGGVLVGGDLSAEGDGAAWLAKVGGDPAASGVSGGFSVPAIPDWTGPFAGGVLVGGAVAGLAMRFRDRD